jgi:hypothetical protein
MSCSSLISLKITASIKEKYFKRIENASYFSFLIWKKVSSTKTNTAQNESALIARRCFCISKQNATELG